MNFIYLDRQAIDTHFNIILTDRQFDVLSQEVIDWINSDDFDRAGDVPENPIKDVNDFIKEVITHIDSYVANYDWWENKGWLKPNTDNSKE